jgi:hypothetical protein
MADCYYLDGARNQQGPVPADEIARLIRSGTIRRDTMVWSAGMPEWQPAGQVSDFAALFGQAPPARPSAPPSPAFPAAPAMPRTAPSVGAYQGQPRQAQVPQYGPARSMGFIEAIKTCFSAGTKHALANANLLAASARLSEMPWGGIDGRLLLP